MKKVRMTVVCGGNQPCSWCEKQFTENEERWAMDLLEHTESSFWRFGASKAIAQKWRFGQMKALSIRQPWAFLIVSGFKDIENRILA